MPKFGSSFTFGRGPETAPILNGPSPRLIRVGIGPPPPCVIEYIFHPPPMLALIRAIPLPPAGILDGATDIDSETGFWAHTAAADIANARHNNIGLSELFNS